MFWTFLKDVLIIFLVLMIGFLAGVKIEIEENADMLDIEEKIEQIKDAVLYYKDKDLEDVDDFEGRLNMFVVDNTEGVCVNISFPYSYIKFLDSCGIHGELSYSNGFNINLDIDEGPLDEIKSRGIFISLLRNLKAGTLLIRKDDDDETSVYVWRTIANHATPW